MRWSPAAGGAHTGAVGAAASAAAIATSEMASTAAKTGFTRAVVRRRRAVGRA